MKLGMEETDTFKAFSFIKVPSIEKCLFYLKPNTQGAVKGHINMTDAIEAGSLMAFTLPYLRKLLISKPPAGTFRTLRKSLGSHR